jgi:hypothetical protein
VFHRPLELPPLFQQPVEWFGDVGVVRDLDVIKRTRSKKSPHFRH